jgi:hypothetical protein
MEKEDLIKKLQEMDKPNFVNEQHRAELKMTLLNASKSAKAGVLLVVLPLLFLTGVFLKYLLHIHLPSFTRLEDWMAEEDKVIFYRVLIAILLIGAPLLGLGLNLLAIVHMVRNREADEIIITIKLRWINILVSIVCAIILFVFLCYAIGENVNR